MIESALGVLARQLSISDHATFQRSMRADLVAPSSRLTASSTANTCKVADLVAERTWPFVAKRPEQTRTECANVNGILRNVRLQRHVELDPMGVHVLRKRGTHHNSHGH